jgi:hypothetical protein
MLFIIASTLFAGIAIGILPIQQKMKARPKGKKASCGWLDSAFYIVDKYDK